MTAQRELGRWVDAAVRSEGVPSLSVAVASPDGSIEATAGFADIAKERLATPETVYLAASVTKPVTAAAVVSLAARGGIDLDQRIDEFELPAPLTVHSGTRYPTVRELLEHRAGLGTHHRFFYRDLPARPPSAATTLRTYAHVMRPAGSGYVYSNLGYGVLDELVRRSTGDSPEDYVRETVFERLQMHASSIGVLPSHDNAAERYGGDRVPYPAYDVDHRGASLGWFTAADLVRFGLANCEPGRLLPARWLQQMHADVATGEGQRGYALGWGVYRSGPLRLLSHGGAMGGVSSVIAVLPDFGIAVAALVNVTGSDLPRQALRQSLRAVLPAYACDIDAVTPEPMPVVAATTPPAATTVGSWAGQVSTHEGEVAVRLDVTADGIVAGTVGGVDKAVGTRLLGAGGDLAAVVPGVLPVEPPVGPTQSVALVLFVAGGDLEGFAAAVELTAGEGGHPSRRMRSLVSHYVRLHHC